MKNGNEGRLEDIRGRPNNTNALLGIDRKTSSTQNADLLEALLSYFELMKASLASTSNTVLTTAESSQATLVLASSIQPTSDKKPRKRQIYVDSVVEDPYFKCTGKGLTSLVKYFAENPRCECCHEKYQLEVPCFNWCTWVLCIFVVFLVHLPPNSSASLHCSYGILYLQYYQ